jgi:hypothetical protein
MKQSSPTNYTFEYIAAKRRLTPKRTSFLKKIYKGYSHSLITLREKVIELNLSNTEALIIFTYHGFVASGAAVTL